MSLKALEVEYRDKNRAVHDLGESDAMLYIFFFSSRRRHTRFDCDWSSDVCSSDLPEILPVVFENLENNVLKQSVVRGVRGELSSPVTGEAALCSKPERALCILINAVNRVVREAVPHREDRELAILITTQSIVRAHPQVAVTILRDHTDQVAWQTIQR